MGENSIFSKYSYYRKIIFLKKIHHYRELEDGEIRSKTKNGANKYAFEFMKKNLCKYVSLTQVQDYCNEENKRITGQPLGDPPRAFEILRKNKLPNEWEEIKINNKKYVKFSPSIKYSIDVNIVRESLHKNNNFTQKIILEKLKSSNYTCEITELPDSESRLAADHFISKEKGGESIKNNCVIINKILNEKKNNKHPIEWFCDSFLKNFMNICKKCGILKECKTKFIKFIQEFE